MIRPRFTSLLAWATPILYIALGLPGYLLDRALRARGLPSQEGDPATYLAFLAFAVIGALIASRRPRNPLGWIFCAIPALAMISFTPINYGYYATLVVPGQLPAVEFIAWLGSWAWFPTLGLVITFLPLLFPDGSVPSRRWRIVGWIDLLGIVFISASFAFKPGPLSEGVETVVNPAGLQVPMLIDLFGIAGGVLLAVGALLSVASLVVRYRRAGTEQRLQIKWFAFAIGLFASMMAMFIAFPALEQAVDAALSGLLGDLLFAVLFTLIPTSVAVAVLKYRLYDIDVVINRTLVYGSLTAILAAAYFGLVALFQTVLAPLTEGSDLAIVASTLAVAALFRPARARIQRFIDRRFYRNRYDATKTLESFGARLRDEVELGAVSSDLIAVVDRSLQPAHASLWLRDEVQR